MPYCRDFPPGFQLIKPNRSSVRRNCEKKTQKNGLKHCHKNLIPSIQFSATLAG
jgi:hypothetical protein